MDEGQESRRWQRASWVLALAAATAALATVVGCGGKVVVDAVGDCECDDVASCPVGDACGSTACKDCRCVPVPEPEGTACPDGYCDGAGACFTRAQICVRACEYIPVCMTSTPAECYDFCFNDLSDCSSSQMRDTDHCTETLTPQCQADAWLACITPILCLETEH